MQSNYIKPPLAVDTDDRFGTAIALSDDGGTLLVSSQEDSGSVGIGGDQLDNSVEDTGAIFVY